MVLYEFKYNDYQNRITVTAIEMRETAKSYKPVDGRDVAIYKEKLSKDDVGKLLTACSSSYYYSTNSDVRPFLSELDKKYEQKINTLKEEIQKAQEQKDKIKFAEVVTGS